MIARINHMSGYTNFRGHNKAFAHEEFMKIALFWVIMGAFCSSIRVSGVPRSLISKMKSTGFWQRRSESRFGMRVEKLRDGIRGTYK